jgi:hypothetical protein
MREQRDQLDEALDDALASYGKAPEYEELERRILARVTERAKCKRPMRPLVMAFGAALPVVMACLFWWVTSKTPLPNRPASTSILVLSEVKRPAIPSIFVPEPAAVPVRAARQRRTPKKIAEPKLPQFPTPSPLTSEERALLRLASHDAKDSRRELTYLGSPIKPIQIAAVEIKPL